MQELDFHVQAGDMGTKILRYAILAQEPAKKGIGVAKPAQGQPKTNAEQ